jgi:hypothetical protein
MLLPIFLSTTLWLPMSGLNTLKTDHVAVFNQFNTVKPSEFQALILNFDYGYAPEPYKPSRREKIALKLTKVTKMNTEAKD